MKFDYAIKKTDRASILLTLFLFLQTKTTQSYLFIVRRYSFFLRGYTLSLL